MPLADTHLPSRHPGREKYETLIGADLWGYIDRINGWFPPELAGATIETQRAVYDRMCSALHAGYPPGVLVEDAGIASPDGGIPVRRYTVANPRPAATIVYFHGGGFVLGDLDSHDDICAEMCHGTGLPIVSVAYRLAPEHSHPQAFRDACTALAAICDATRLPVLLCGESAGGNLAAAAAHWARRHGIDVAGQVLIYPSLGGDAKSTSRIEHAEAPLLSTEDLATYGKIRTAGDVAPDDFSFEPLRDRDFRGLPKTIIFTAEFDPLADDGDQYRDAVIAAGGKAFCFREPGLVHSYLRARHTVASAAQAFGRIVAALAVLGRGEWRTESSPAECRTRTAEHRTQPCRRRS